MEPVIGSQGGVGNLETKSQNPACILSTWQMVPHPAWKIAWSENAKKCKKNDEQRFKIGPRGSVRAETLAK